jgi:hypothetical protein
MLVTPNWLQAVEGLPFRQLVPGEHPFELIGMGGPADPG